MLQKIMFLTALFMLCNKNVEALNSIDKFILNQGGVTECNGEGPNCRDFYTRAIELNDDRSPISPEIKF